MKKFNPFHLVELSPWPFLSSVNALSFGLSVIIMVTVYNCKLFLMSLILFLFVSFLWGRDIHREGCYEGEHNEEVMAGFKLGMIFFILSECFFFLGMFWAYLHLAQTPPMDLGMVWPPVGVTSFDPKGVPFLNTILLVSSGVSVTWCHHSMEEGSYVETLISLGFTVFLGLVFTCFQALEYYIAGFSFSCSSYSSVYFMGTGFHGLHVIIGSVLLIVSGVRFFFLHSSPNHSVGFECSVWYWHFVDVVWFMLYLVFYWWGV
uniref:Cytochrome c oxidase subunit 3 n=1 Tax=Myocoptes musculinus TaxID=1046713 RepID=A0A109ZRJ8_9ACAR|nr:cytochrome c oxidase subunit III [Myocoptes musculinus]